MMMALGVFVFLLSLGAQGVHRAPTSVEALEAAFQDRYSALKRVYEQRLHGLVGQVGAAQRRL